MNEQAVHALMIAVLFLILEGNVDNIILKFGCIITGALFLSLFVIEQCVG